MPTLYILAGPNGAGKTTYYETAATEGFIDSNLSFINVDLITRSLPGMYTPENFAKPVSARLQRVLVSHSGATTLSRGTTTQRNLLHLG